jgi:hypothetical protein
VTYKGQDSEIHYLVMLLELKDSRAFSDVLSNTSLNVVRGLSLLVRLEGG